MMNVSMEDKKIEAIKRMKMMNIYEETIDQFQKDDLVSYSDDMSFGACFWLTDAMKDKVKELEKEYNCLVYHVIRSHMILGGTDKMVMNSYLFVSDYKDDWDLEHDDIKDGYVFAYVENETDPILSEMGTIGYRLSVAHGLLRTA